MKKVEILSPAGNKEMFYTALENGADAIYLAGKLYGARGYADNFTNEDLKEVISYAHLYGVKVYVTINTLIYENEVKGFTEYVKYLYLNNVDAVLMQDLGMIKLVREMFPNLPIHASTQFHNHNKEGIKYLKEIGVKRVVLARELSLDEIKQIDVDIEKEVFVYGALCISYSGCCLASYCLKNRSGNRGLCAGICRLPYELYYDKKKVETEGKYLLSPKELNTLSNLREILNSNIDSIKIEGRMKSPAYVGYVTRLFRRLVDEYYNNEAMTISEEEIKNLKKLYNRDFTLGHLFNEKNSKLMNIKAPNHMGYPLGMAEATSNKIKIYLTDDIAQGDGIRFANQRGMIVNYLYDKNNLLINGAKKGEIVYVDNKVDFQGKGEVLKTLDVLLEEKIKDIPKRKVKVDIKIRAKLNEPLKAMITDGEHEIINQLGMVEKSINAPIKKQELVERFSKLNDTPFVLNDIEIVSDDNIFIPVKIMNELRRTIVNKLITARTKATYEPVIKEAKNQKINILKTNSYNFLVRNEEQLKYLFAKDVNIYITDYDLYKKYKSPKVFYVTDRVSFNLPDFQNENIMASNLSSIIKYSKNNLVYSDIYLNVINSFAAKELFDLGAKKVSLSIENDFEDIKNIMDSFKDKYSTIPNFDVLVYGKVELMVLKHCFLKMFLNKDKKCNLCKDNKKYYLQNDLKEQFRVLNRNCNSYILSSQKIDLVDNIDKYKELGITNFTFNLDDESNEQIEDILVKLGLKN